MPVLRIIFDQSLRNHHKERRRNPLAGDIRHHKSDPVIINLEEIVEISAHLFGRFHTGIKVYFFDIRKGREGTWQSALLNIGGQLQFPGGHGLVLALLYVHNRINDQNKDENHRKSKR